MLLADEGAYLEVEVEAGAEQDGKKQKHHHHHHKNAVALDEGKNKKDESKKKETNRMSEGPELGDGYRLTIGMGHGSFSSEHD